jgi:centrosomal protein CEP76
LLKLISKHREKQKLSFAFDEVLSSLLSTVLANYEIERVTGLTFCEEEFQTAIKGYIPAKHTFKAFPIQLTTLD